MPTARQIRILASILLAHSSTSFAQHTNAIPIGMRRAEVIAIKGRPTGSFQRGAGELLVFADGSVTLRDGKVAETDLLSSDQYEAQKKQREEERVRREEAARVAAQSPAQAGEVAWETDFAKAVADAAQSQRCLLLDFTGSDWCGWCKKLDAEVFGRDDFKTLAAQKLICVQLDFPRKKDQSPQLKQQNSELAAKYDVDGYPTVVLLSPGGDVLGQLVGFPQGAQPYLDSLKELIVSFERSQTK